MKLIKIMKTEKIILSVLILFSIFNFIDVEATQNEIDELLKEAYEVASIQNYDEAIMIYDKVLEIDPANTKALNNKAGMLVQKGEINNGLVLINRILEIDPENEDALTNKGTFLGMIGDYEDALFYLDKALEIDPENENALNNKGGVLINLNRFDEALTYFEKALEIDPDIHEPLNNYFKVLQEIEFELSDALVQTTIRNSDGKLIAYLESDKIFQKNFEGFDEALLNTNKMIDTSVVMKNQELFYLFEFETVFVSDKQKLLASIEYFLLNSDNEKLNFNALWARHHGIILNEGDEVTTLWKIIVPV